MKKFLSILLTILLLFCLASCKNEESDTDDEPVHENTFEDYLSIYARKVPDQADTSTLDLSLYAPAQGFYDFSGLYGYATLDGEWIIYPTVSYTGVFSDGLATYTNSYNMYQYVMKDNTTVLTTFDGDSIVEDIHANDGILVLKTDRSSLQPYCYVNTETLWYAFDHDIVPYVQWREYDEYYRFAVATSFNSEGKAVVMRLKNTDITDDCDKESAYVIDKKGKVIATLPKGLDASEYAIDTNGAIIVTDENGLYGLCSDEGKVLIEPTYKFLRHCEGPLYLVCNDQGMWGYVDKNDNIVIELQYYKASNFSDGIAAVYNGEKWGFIDENGEIVIDFIFDNYGNLEQGDLDRSLDEGPCREGLLAIEKDGYWAIIDKNKNVIISINEKDLEGVDGCPYSGMMNGVIIFKKNVDGTVLYGAFNYEGELIFDAKFSSLGAFN